MKHYSKYRLTVYVVVFLSFFLINETAYSICCLLDYELIATGNWTAWEEDAVCPNNKNFTCDRRERTMRSYLQCLSIGCIGDRIYPCKPTQSSNPRIIFADACGSANLVTDYWREYETRDCEVFDCFYICSDYAEESINDAECP